MIADGVIDRSGTQDTPGIPLAPQGRLDVWDLCCGNHLGQRSCANAKTGRTYGRKRSDQIISKYLASRGPSTYEIRHDIHNEHLARDTFANLKDYRILSKYIVVQDRDSRYVILILNAKPWMNDRILKIYCQSTGHAPARQPDRKKGRRKISALEV